VLSYSISGIIKRGETKYGYRQVTALIYTNSTGIERSPVEFGA